MNYDIALYIDSEKVSESLIAENINVRRNEGESGLMDFTLITASGSQDVNEYTGKAVRLDVIADAGVYRLFTGTIDYPVIDLINRRIQFQCSSNRKELINELDVSMVGYWSDAIFNEAKTPAEELDLRLKTTPKTLDFDTENNHTINDINPKVTPDFTLQDIDVFYRKPALSVVSSSEIVNNITLNFALRYPRKRQRERRFQIGTATFCEVSSGQAEFTNVKEALDNIEGTGWTINPDSIGYEYLPSSDWITCVGQLPFIWYNNNDPHIYVLSVFYTAAIRFAQTIIESYEITVKAPQSITQYGEKDAVIKNSLDIDFDVSVWEDNKHYQPKTDLTADDNDYYTDEDGTDIAYSDAIKTALNIAKTDILRSHRKNTVDFETFLFPTVDLKHTVKVDTAKIVATGKVTSINHTLDVNKRFGSTSLEISFSTAQGSQSSDIFSEPDRVSVPVIGEEYIEPLVIATVEDDIAAPPIDNLSRNTQTVETTETYNVEIPDSTLTVTF